MANGSTLDQWNVMPDWLRALLGPMGPREAVPGLEQAKRGFPGPMPKAPSGPSDPLAALGILDPSQQQAPGPELPIGPRRQSAVTGMMPGLGEMPAPQRDSGPPFLRGAPLPGGMDDTRFRGPTGQMAPEVDLGGAVLPGAADTRLFREPPQAAPQGGAGDMDPQRRLELMKAARMFREGASEFANIPNAADFMLARHGVPMRDYRVRDEDLRADEERVRRGDFENPNSPASQMARQMLSQLTGQEAPESMSASAVMGISPVFDRLIRAQYAGFGQQLALEREDRAQRGEERHVRERGEDIRRGREKDLRGAFATERKDWLSPTGQLGKYREGIEMTDKALALLEQGGPQAFGTALSLIIKGVGKEAGNIAQKEREVLLGEIGIPGLVTKGIKAWTGDYSPEQYQAMKNVAKKAKELLERDRDGHRAQRLDSFAKTHRELLEESGIGMDELQQRLGVETAVGGMNAQPAAAPTSRGGGAARPTNGGGWIKGSDGKKYPYDPDLPVGTKFRDPEGNIVTVEQVAVNA